MTNELRVLSLWQPWASFCVRRPPAKRYETRPRSLAYRGPLAIHATKDQPKGAVSEEVAALCRRVMGCHWWELPRGAIVGTVIMLNCEPTMHYSPAEISEQERLVGDWSTGRFCYELSNPIPWEKPFAAAGKQGLWRIQGLDRFGYAC